MQRKRKHQGVKSKDLFVNVGDDVPKAYRPDNKLEESSSEELPSETEAKSDNENQVKSAKKEDSGLDSDENTDMYENVQVSSLLSDMERLKQDLINRNEYDKLKEKCKKSDSNSD